MSVFRRRRHHVYGGGGVTPFSPLDVSGLVLWLDASDAATITQSSGAVSQWNDKSGNSNHATQAIGVSQPTTGTTTINSKNTIYFDQPTADYMTFASQIGTDTYCAFMAGLCTSAGAAPRNIIGGSGQCFNFRLSATNLQMQIVTTNVAVRLTGATNTSTATPYIYSAQSQPTGNRVRLNGVSDGSNATNPAYTNGFTELGSSIAGLNQFHGQMGEVIIYTSALTDANINLIGAYLAAKWGITWTPI